MEQERQGGEMVARREDGAEPKPIIVHAGETISRVSLDGVSAPVARFNKDLDVGTVERSISAAVQRMIAADKRRVAIANRATPRRQHIEVFNRDLRRVSRLAKAYDDAREQAMRMKVVLRSLSAQSGNGGGTR